VTRRFLKEAGHSPALSSTGRPEYGAMTPEHFLGTHGDGCIARPAHTAKVKQYRVVCVRPEFLEPGNLPDKGMRCRIDAVSDAGMVRNTGSNAKRIKLDRSKELPGWMHA
jgi:hypothetical protein